MSTKKKEPYRTFNPWSVHHVRGSMGYAVEIKYDPRDGGTPRVVDLSPVADLSYGEANRLEELLVAFFKTQPQHVWRGGEMIRREIKARTSNMKHKEREANEERTRIAALEAELRRRA